MSTTKQPAFTCWHRQTARRPWPAVVQAESEAKALAMLLTAAKAGDLTVTPTGQDPNGRPKPIRQRHTTAPFGEQLPIPCPHRRKEIQMLDLLKQQIAECHDGLDEFSAVLDSHGKADGINAA